MFYVYVHHEADTGNPFYVDVRDGARPHYSHEPGVRVELFCDVKTEEAGIMWEKCLIDAYRNAGYFLINKKDKGLEYRLAVARRRQATKRGEIS